APQLNAGRGRPLTCVKRGPASACQHCPSTHDFDSTTTRRAASASKRADKMRRIALACLVVAATAGAATADTLADCSQPRNAQTRLRACSEIIASPAYGGADKA